MINRDTEIDQSNGRAAARDAAAFFVPWELLWVCCLAPFFVFPPVGRPLLLVILLLPLTWVIRIFRRSDPLPVTPLNGALGLVVLMVLVSLWATYDIPFSAGKVLGVVLGVAMCFALVRTLSDERRVDAALTLFVIAGTVLAVIGLLGTNWIGKVPIVSGLAARLPAVIRGVPGQSEGFQPNAIAGALVMFFPLQIALLLRARASVTIRVLHAGMLALVAGTIVLTQSRNGWISLAVALSAWSLWQGRRTRAMSGGVAVVGVAVMVIAWNRVFPLLAKAFGSGMQANVESRPELWSRAVYGIQDFPLTGMGMNTFRRVMPVLYPTFLTSPDVDVAHAHNHLLQAGLDLGLPGLIGYLSLWLVAATLLVVAIRRAGDPDRRLVAGGLAAGMIAYFAFGTVDAIALGAKVGIFFWIALALVVAVHRSALYHEERL